MAVLPFWRRRVAPRSYDRRPPASPTVPRASIYVPLASLGPPATGKRSVRSPGDTTMTRPAFGRRALPTRCWSVSADGLSSMGDDTTGTPSRVRCQIESDRGYPHRPGRRDGSDATRIPCTVHYPLAQTRSGRSSPDSGHHGRPDASRKVGGWGVLGLLADSRCRWMAQPTRRCLGSRSPADLHAGSRRPAGVVVSVSSSTTVASDGRQAASSPSAYSSF